LEARRNLTIIVESVRSRLRRYSSDV
jgi:hypothetical protein